MAEIIQNEGEEKSTVSTDSQSRSFIEQMVKDDLAAGKNGGRMQTRFPPEPNGYLHIGHAKAIAIDFGLAQKYGGECNLRFDDTNPQKEDTEFIESIEQDIKWLGYEWAHVYYASDYFQELWDFAVWLIKQGRAYVDEQSAEVIAQQKGTTTSPGTNSPYRDRPVEENLQLFEFMNSGKCEPGKMVLRAKIDMTHPNMLFRDPLIYRVLNIPHVKTGDKWNAYPMYDFTHGQSDYLEGVTHSWCTLEFVEHRPLYDLFVGWMKEWMKAAPHSAPEGATIASSTRSTEAPSGAVGGAYFDCVVIIRGGGATADLSGFDTLALAENVAQFPLPIITGIGHDRDESILDMVSHTRVKTPTAAAQLLISHLDITAQRIDTCAERINTFFTLLKTREEARIDKFADYLPQLISRLLERESHRLELLEQRTKALDPTLLLKRGYSITLHNGHLLRDPALLKPGDEIETRLEKGNIISKV